MKTKNIKLLLANIIVYFLKDKLYAPLSDGRIAVYNCSFTEFLSLMDGDDKVLNIITTRKKTYVDEIPPTAQFTTVNSDDTIVMYSVNSSNIESVGWKDNKLYVKFLNGGIYEYSNITPDLWEGMKHADSKGSWLHWWLKINSDAYPYKTINNLEYVVSIDSLENPGTPHPRGYMTGFSKQTE